MSFAADMLAFVRSGCEFVTQEQYRARLSVCQQCLFRGRRRCLKCKCLIAVKAKGRAWNCPLGKWPRLDLGEPKEQ